MATPHLPATHCYPVATLTRALRPDDGTLRVFKPTEVLVIAEYLGQTGKYDTAAVLFAPDDRAFVFLGKGGRFCMVFTEKADKVKDVIRAALGDAI